jgi:hypothetical protein
LGALEAEITYVDAGLAITPMGLGVGMGALHLVDVRGGSVATSLVPTGNPASYDLLVSTHMEMVLAAEDDGNGGTILRGYRYNVPGLLIPLVPSFLVLPGRPCAHVTEMGLDASGSRVYVSTSVGVSIVELSPSGAQMSLQTTVSTGAYVPMTNLQSFDRNGITTWVVGTSSFNASGQPTEAGYASWNSTGGAFTSGVWGTIPLLFPLRSYVPAAGTTELAVVGDGVDAYVYFLLRDPSPTASFIRPSGVGAVRFLGHAAPDLLVIEYPTEGGEPFAIPTVNGTRIAIESSQGPPFSFSPPDGGEPIAVLYTPLDSLATATSHGLLAVPSPLGGRISTKGMDRPIWTRDGTRVVAATSHFPGAPNPGSPGIEVLNVPELVPVNFFTPPHYVVPNFISPHRSIIFPSSFIPRDAASASFLDGFSFVGNVFHNGMASIMVTPFGEIGQFQTRNSNPFVQSPLIPNFPSVHPPVFADATASTVPLPGNFGARRASWNLYPNLDLMGLMLTAAMNDKILYQVSGWNFLVAVGVMAGPSVNPVEVPLPAGWVTTSEILSL